jgi:hypothetical protein
MALSKLQAKMKGIKYLPLRQGLITYNLYDLPKGFVIEGNVDLSCKNLTELPDLSEVVVKGYFSCSNNQLTSLEGAPKEVGGSFWCYGNILTSLKGAPKEVGVNFDCHVNRLTSLDGAPQTVGGSFNCSHNQLTSLEGAPEEVGGGFDCNRNQLTSLNGAPQKIDGHFNCEHNQLTSLKGAPKEVGRSFWCAHNQLTSLEGAPQMNEGYEIYCDKSLGTKYGFYVYKYHGIKYEELCASPLYKSEAAMNRVRSKQQEKQVETKSASSEQQKTVEPKQQEAFEKINAEFSQWLNDNKTKTSKE